MPCLLILIAWFFPRLALVLIWLLSDYLSRAYQTALWPVLGFLFMPYTTLAYAWAINGHGSVSGLGMVAVVLGVLLDLGAIGGGGKRLKGRRR